MSVRWTSRMLTGVGVVLLLLGALAGWLAPRLGLLLGAANGLVQLRATVAGSGMDVGGFLGADVTALSVIIAIVIGFSATTLQIAGQAHSLALVRAILLSLTPFLACWSLTTGVALIYFLLPPVYIAQVWQIVFWFGAVIVLMLAYLWDLPWRLSGQYVAHWALQGLRGIEIHLWEAQDSYSALQTSVAGASARGDLGTVRDVTTALGRFLVGIRDARAEATPAYDRGRYRSLKNLLSGCAQNAGAAPNAVAYHLGAVLAGVLLQASATGHPMDDPDHDLYSGILRELRERPERINPLWTGMRHALCRATGGKQAYLLQFWLEHARWTSDDPRRVSHIAEGIAAFHTSCWQALRTALPASDATAEAADLIVNLYRDLTTHLAKDLGQATRQSRRTSTLRFADLPLGLLDATHAELLRAWPAADADAGRVSVINAYESRRAELLALLSPTR